MLLPLKTRWFGEKASSVRLRASITLLFVPGSHGMRPFKLICMLRQATTNLRMNH